MNVFVLGLDEMNEAVLEEVPERERYRFHPLLTMEELQQGEIPIEDLLAKAREQLDGFDGPVDAIVGFWDFPVTSMVPILCAERGLRSAPLSAVVTCEHKYWSRLRQREAAPEAVPPFALVNTAHDTEPPEGLEYPMWLKPIKGFSSELAYGVDDDAEFAEAVKTIREGLDRVGEPFQFVLDQVELPDDIARIDPHCCLAEQAMSGNQVATEGYVFEGDVRVYGVLDSIDYPDSSVFLRHQYPSQLPEEVTERLIEVSRRVIAQTGLDNSTFSIEFFHDPRTDHICLLEINARHSQSHAALFWLVDGVPNHHVMLSLATGRDPGLGHGAGDYRVAAIWNHRRFSDGIVRRVPSRQEIEAIEKDVPGVRIHPHVEPGQRLSELDAQDSYSFELTDVVVGADSVEAMEEKYQRVIDALNYEFEDVDAGS